MKDIVKVVFNDGSEAIIRDDINRSMCIIGSGIASQLITRKESSCLSLKKLIDDIGIDNCQISTDYDEDRGTVKEGEEVFIDHHSGVLISGIAHFTGIGHLPWVAKCMNGTHRLFY